MHKKYERTREAIGEFKCNEDSLKAAYSDVDRRLKKSEDRFELLKSHAESKLQEANETIATMQRRNESELARMHAMIRQVFTRLPDGKI